MIKKSSGVAEAKVITGASIEVTIPISDRELHVGRKDVMSLTLSRTDFGLRVPTLLLLEAGHDDYTRIIFDGYKTGDRWVLKRA